MTRAVNTTADESGDTGTDTSTDVLDVPGAARLLGIGRNALYDAIGRGEVPHRRIGKSIRLSRAALLAWLGGAA